MSDRLFRFGKLLFLVPILFLVFFFFFPLVNILVTSFDPGAIEDLLSSSYYWNVLLFTFGQAFLSTFLTLLLGIPAAFLFSHYEFKGKSFLRALVTVPFVLPTVVVAAAFQALLGPNGPINNVAMAIFNLEKAPLALEHTLTIILLAHIYYNLAIVIRLVGGFWMNLSPRLTEAARTLGASRAQTFYRITLPILRPAITSSAILIFLFTFTSFGVILLLGGPAFSTMETEIYRQYVTFLNFEIAGLLAIIQIVFTFLTMAIYARWQRQSVVPLDFVPQSTSTRQPENRVEKIVVIALMVGLSLFMLSPLLALVARSFMGRQGEFTLAYYQALPELHRGSVTFVSPLVAIRNSIGYAILTMIIAIILGTISATFIAKPSRWRGLFDPLFMLPLGVSAVTLGFGYVLSLGPLRTSPLLVLIAHTLVALPFVVRSLLPVLMGIRPNLRESASILGASPFQVWRQIDLPILSRAMLVAAIFAFTVSMGEFGATSFIVRPNSGFLTMPIAIQRFLGQPGALNFGQAMAMSTILMFVCAAGFIIIERFRYGEIGEF